MESISLLEISLIFVQATEANGRWKNCTSAHWGGFKDVRFLAEIRGSDLQAWPLGKGSGRILRTTRAVRGDCLTRGMFSQGSMDFPSRVAFLTCPKPTFRPFGFHDLVHF